MSDQDDGGGRATDYWATREGTPIVAAIREQVRRYVRYSEECGLAGLQRHAHRMYYGLDREGDWTNAACVQFGGEQGENVLLRTNHYRSLVDHIGVLTTGSRPSYSARSMNSDYKSQAQTLIAEGMLDYYLTVKRLETQAVEATWHALRYQEGWMYIGWDARAGDPVSVTEAEPSEEGEQPRPVVEYEGDIESRVFMPRDIARDVTASSVDEMQWIIAHRRVPRWDLAARYPEHRDGILQAPEYDTAFDYQAGSQIMRRRAQGEMVSVLELWHGKTDAIPDGRFALVCGDALLMDGPLPFEELPFVAMMPGTIDGTAFGYCGTIDLLALQEAFDAAMSTVMTNHDAFGRQTLWAQKGSGFKASDLAGMTLIESEEPPQVLKLIQAQGECYTLIDLLRASMEAISGINSVARGEPQASLKSGSALALVHAMAVQINAAIQKAYANLFEKMGTMVLSRLKTFAKTKRMAEITGKAERSMLIEFSGDSIKDVQRVVVELGSPVLRTSAGRKELADKWFEASLNTATPMTFPQYMAVMSTGRLEPITQRAQSQRLNIVRENEALLDGRVDDVRALVTDDHSAHIQEHLSVLDDPSVRMDNALSANTLAHVQEHCNLWVSADPVLLAATGQQAAPAPAMPPPMPMGAPMGGMPGMPDMGGMGGPQMGIDMSQQPADVQAVNMPNMPNLPPGTDPSVAEAAAQFGGATA